MTVAVTSTARRVRNWVWPRTGSRRLPTLSIVAVGSAMLLALIADFLPLAPTKINLVDRLSPPFWYPESEYLLGADTLGRDVLSRLVYGARTSLTLGVITIVVAAIVGTLLGIVAGYFGGRVDMVVSRLIDATLTLPVILVALMFVVIMGPGFVALVAAISLFLWGRFARVIRGEVLALRQQDFVKRAQVAGCSTGRIFLRHLLPNVANTVVVVGTIHLGWVIIAESSLSFLGLGVPPPNPSWGQMVADGREYLRTAWWLSTIPGLTITLVVLGISTLGDWLRDWLDPQLRNLGARTP